jgi:sarcosine oxidase subunit beta
MYSPLRSQADPRKATRAFAALAARAGATVLTDHAVTALAPRRAGGYIVATSRGEVVAPILILAAGAWCGPIGAMLGLDIPIVPVRGQMWATEPVPPRVFQTIASAESALDWHRAGGGEVESGGGSGRDQMGVDRVWRCLSRHNQRGREVDRRELHC